MFRLLLVSFLCSLALVKHVEAETAEDGSGRPHIVFIMADDLGWNDVSFHGSTQIPTPNIDKWANEGLILNNYYTQHQCTPSRAALMTGRYPIRYGLQNGVITGGQRLGLFLNEKIMPQYFHKLGYTSHILGKWHLGFFNKLYTPTYRGFKSYYGLYNGKMDYFDHTCIEKDGYWGLDWHNETVTSEGEHELKHVWTDFGLYSNDVLVRELEKILDNKEESEPLFLYLPFQSVHSANDDMRLQAPDNDVFSFPNIWEEYRRYYAGSVKSLDRSVGQVFDLLIQQNMLNNSIVVFSSDNGGPANGFNYNYASNTPLRGVKETYWEGGVRSVGFVYSPKYFGKYQIKVSKKPLLCNCHSYERLSEKRAGQISRDLMHITDWLPTLYDLIGGNSSELINLDGVSQMGALTGEGGDNNRTEMLIASNRAAGVAALRLGRFKLGLNLDHVVDGWNLWYIPTGSLPNTNLSITPNTTASQVTCGPVPTREYHCWSKKLQEPLCMYDIEQDPCEHHNLVDKDHLQGIRDKMINRLLEYMEEEVPAPNPPLDPKGDPRVHGYKWVPWTDDPAIPKSVDFHSYKDLKLTFNVKLY